MANNYSITRQTLDSETYGCTEFSTLQQGGEIASLSGQTPLDGTIKWDITAHAGYGVDAVDFTIDNATVVNSPSTTFIWTGGDLPSDVLGVVFYQFSPTVVEATIYLHPDSTNGITGSAYTMPSSNVLINIPITGCAKLLPNGIHVTVRGETNTDQVVTVSEGSGITKATSTVGIYTEHLLTGSLLTDREKQTSIATYTTTANSGYYYSTQSNYTVPNSDYTITRTAFTKNANGFYTSETFNITYGSTDEVGFFDNHVIDFTNSTIPDLVVSSEVSSFDTSLENIDDSGDSRRLVATGDALADYDIYIERENRDTYDFTTNTFTATNTKLSATISNSGSTVTSVNFPKSATKDKYTIWLAAGAGSTLHSNVPTDANPLYIFQYPSVVVTVDGESATDAFNTIVGTSSITIPPNTDVIDLQFNNIIDVDITVTPKAGEGLTIVKSNPTISDLLGSNVFFSKLTEDIDDTDVIPITDNTHVPIGSTVMGSSITTKGDYIGDYMSSSNDGLSSKFLLNNATLLAVGMLVDSFNNGDVPQGIKVVQADLEGTEQVILINSDAKSWMDTNDSIDFRFTLPFTTDKIPPFTTVVGKSAPNNVILSNNISANLDDTLAFDFGGLDIFDSKLQAVSVGDDVNITGTIIVAKSGDINSDLKLQLDNIITSA